MFFQDFMIHLFFNLFFMKDIPWYEWLYRATIDGKIFWVKRGKILQYAHDKEWYANVCLRLKWLNRKSRVHRLVALTFISNPENKPYINHKNGIRDDNRVENLEWCTQKENVIHSFRNGRIIHNRKAVWMYDKITWEIIRTFPSVSEAWISLWVCIHNISACARWARWRKSTWWYIWKYL